jgi:hypothetical protein
MAHKSDRMDQSLGVGEKGNTPLYGLTHHATESPHHLEEQELVKSSNEMRTPEFEGHMRRIGNKAKR